MTYEAFRRARAYGYNPGPGIAYGDGGYGGGGGAGFQAFSNALFPTSVNPEFNPKDPNAVDPYTGTNFISRWKAGKANKEFQKQKVLADFASNQAFEDYKKQVEFASDQARKDAQKEYELKQKWSEEALGDTGTYLGQAAGNLPTDTLSRIIPQDQVFSSPQEQAKYVQAQFGPGTVDDYALKSSPEFQGGRLRQEAGRGLMPIGTSGVYDPRAQEQITFGQHQTVDVPTPVTVETVETNPLSPDFNQVVKKTIYVNKPQNVFRPPGRFSVPGQKVNITQEMADQSLANMVGGVSPFHQAAGGIQPDIRGMKDSITPQPQVAPKFQLNLDLKNDQPGIPQKPNPRALKEEGVTQDPNDTEVHKAIRRFMGNTAGAIGRGAKNVGEGLFEAFLHMLAGSNEPTQEKPKDKPKRKSMFGTDLP